MITLRAAAAWIGLITFTMEYKFTSWICILPEQITSSDCGWAAPAPLLLYYIGAGDNMHILEFDRVHSGYDERSRYKTSGTKIMVVGQKYPPPPQFREKIIFC